MLKKFYISYIKTTQAIIKQIKVTVTVQEV